MKVSVRKARHEDIPSIYDITKEAFKWYVSKAGIQQIIPALTETHRDIQSDIENKEVFIAFENHYPIGCVRVDINCRDAYISRFAVRVKYHHTGVGKSLMDAVSKRLRELGVSCACLHTTANYDEPIRFYLSLGFRIVSISSDTGYPKALMCKEY